jgi:hypothetical protein
MVHYISAPNAAGDRLMVGEIVGQQTTILEQIPLPSFANQKFCGGGGNGSGFVRGGLCPDRAGA